MNPATLIRTARTWKGTPWHHQGRAPHHGLDCVGLLVCAARAQGLDVDDFTAYGEEDPDPGTLVEYVSRNCEEVPVEQAQPGDMLLFWIVKPGKPQHAGLLTEEGTIIHARRRMSLPMSRVMEQRLGDFWRERIESAWRWKGAA